LFSTRPVTPASRIYWQDFIVKKTAHIIEYGVFTILLYRGFTNSGVSRKKAAAISIILAVLYGLTDELHQSFTPGREPRLRDVGFDTIGALLAIHIVWKLLPKAPAKLKNLAKNLQIN